jgi:ElaB/YqjD/DUF883 family membrane-anchored ribosome-binding protein
MISTPSESEMKQDIDRISASLAKLLDEVEALLQSGADGNEKRADLAEQTGRAALHRICGHLRNARSETLERARKLDGAVHSHPWRALAATALVSFFAGLLVRRR